MTPNIGTIDRTIRVVVGIAMLALVFVGPQSLWGFLGLIPLVTGLARFCPAYWITGSDTCPPGQCR